MADAAQYGPPQRPLRHRLVPTVGGRPRVRPGVALTMRMVWIRLRGLFGTQRRETDLADEIRAHIDQLADDHVRRGLSPDEARAAARRDFGGVDQMKEQYRDVRGWRFVDDAIRDVRYALRSARRNPVFTVVALISLAIGVGVNSA